MTLREVAALWGASPSTILRWADNGDLPSLRTPGGTRRYVRADIEADYESRRGQVLVKGE